MKVNRLAELLSQRDWPGNVRQFEAEVKRLALTSHGDLDRMIAGAMEDIHPPDEREELLSVLERCGWNRREAARRLGVSESLVRKRIGKYNLVEPQKV